jgi:tetratricopeptide (TPR) repeat protein
MSTFYPRFTVLLFLIITFFCSGIDNGSIFIRTIFAQETTQHPLMIYSNNQFDNTPIVSSNEIEADAPEPNQILPSKPKQDAKKTFNTKKNNINNNNNSKNNSEKTSNKKIRLAAVSSAEEDDRIIPAAPMPSVDSSRNNNKRDSLDNNYIKTNTRRNLESANSYNDFDRNNINDSASPPNSAAQNRNDQPHDHAQPNQPTIDPYHPPIKTASFHGIIPGQSSVKNVIEILGKPTQESSSGDELAQLYSLPELNHIEVIYDKNRIVKSIVIRFDELFPENVVREQFETELLRSRPVLIPDETGRIIGELFPEKGVVFLFSASRNSGAFQVRQIGIEPVISEPFVLRAEATLNDQPSESYRDLIDAIRINRTDAKAYWLLAKIELLQGYTETALLNIQKAIRFDERKPAYHLTFAQILSRMNRVEEAKLYLEETLAICERYPTEKARAYCLLGDFYRTGQNPDYETAYKYHAAAIEIADQLIEHSNPTIRQTAKDILFESRISIAKDIAWGRWKGKERAIKNWLSSAQSITIDPEMIAARRFSLEYPLRLAVCELACQVGMKADNDIESYVKEVILAGEKLLEKTNDTILLQKLQWEIGLAVYDAVQIYQLHGNYEPALHYGELAAEYMELGIKGKTNDSDLYLIGRLYFRLGTIHALGNKNHRAAIEWFNKAKPTFERLFSKINPEELGRFGESLVSMGVSYWQTNQREEAVRLTERGLQQIERGAKLGLVKESAFAIPYSNLMNMYNELGNTERSRYYSNLSSALKYAEQKR